MGVQVKVSLSLDPVQALSMARAVIMLMKTRAAARPIGQVREDGPWVVGIGAVNNAMSPLHLDGVFRIT